MVQPAGCTWFAHYSKISYISHKYHTSTVGSNSSGDIINNQPGNTEKLWRFNSAVISQTHHETSKRRNAKKKEKKKANAERFKSSLKLPHALQIWRGT